MSSCCAPRSAAIAESPCPRCGAIGRPVGDETIDALVVPAVKATLLVVERRFCKTPSCSVVYYGADGAVADKAECRVRVGLKETEHPVPICYCFEFTRADVRRELVETGACTIPARITAEIKAERCACEVKNPAGACCLGEVNKVVNEERVALGAPGPCRSS